MNFVINPKHQIKIPLIILSQKRAHYEHFSSVPFLLFDKLHVVVVRFTVAYGRGANRDSSISFLHLPLLQVCLFSWRTKPPRICCLKLVERSCRNFPEDKRGSGVQRIGWMLQKRLQK